MDFDKEIKAKIKSDTAERLEKATRKHDSPIYHFLHLGYHTYETVDSKWVGYDEYQYERCIVCGDEYARVKQLWEYGP